MFFNLNLKNLNLKLHNFFHNIIKFVKSFHLIQFMALLFLIQEVYRILKILLCFSNEVILKILIFSLNYLVLFYFELNIQTL